MDSDSDLGDESQTSSDEGSTSSDDSDVEVKEIANPCRRQTKLLNLQSIDPSNLNETPKAWYNNFNFSMLDYEEGEEPIELPEY